MRLVLLLFICSISWCAEGQLNYNRGLDWNLPQRVFKRFETEKFLTTYDLCDKVNPFYLRGDFDGDGIPDYAVLVTKRSTKQVGIAIVRSKAQKIEVLGPGGANVQGDISGGDFGWMDAWEIARKQRLEPSDRNKRPGVMVGEGIEVQKTESASAIIYWDGKQYEWYQTSD